MKSSNSKSLKKISILFLVTTPLFAVSAFAFVFISKNQNQNYQNKLVIKQYNAVSKLEATDDEYQAKIEVAKEKVKAEIDELNDYLAKNAINVAFSNSNDSSIFKSVLERVNSDINDKSIIWHTTRAPFQNLIDLLNSTKIKLNGNENKENAVKEIQKLTHISEELKKESIAKINSLNEINTLSKLNIFAARHVNADKRFSQLKTDLKKYTDTMSKQKYLLATNKVEKDNLVKSALNSILEKPGIIELNNDTNINNQKLSVIDLNLINQVINQILDAQHDLNGEIVFLNRKNRLFAQFNTEPLNKVNDKIREQINSKISKASTDEELKIVESEVNESLKIANKIFQKIQYLEDRREVEGINFNLADEDKKNIFFNTLNDLRSQLNLDVFNSLKTEIINASLLKADNLTFNGNENLAKAKTEIANFKNISEISQKQAANDLPTTSLADLEKRLTELEKINTIIGNKNKIVDTFLKLSDEFKAKIKEELSNTDLNQSEEKINLDMENIIEKNTALNKKFNDFENAAYNYISVIQTPTYSASTNGSEQDLVVLNAFNSILFIKETNLKDVKIHKNSFKDGTDVEKVLKVIETIDNAISKLNGNEIINKAKEDLIYNFKNNIKYNSLLVITKTKLIEMVNEVNSNANDWRQKLDSIIKIAEDRLAKN
ncbi:hypothetical protein ACW95P_01200 [Candidatus Mycoplasma pogonae]